jgi:hypothetical protein
MKRFAVFVAVVIVVGLASVTAHGQVVYGPAYPVPVTTYYAPAPVTTYYAPGPAYYAPGPMPVTTYYGPAPVYVGRPAVVPPRYFYPGQPVRNIFRRGVVVW